MTAPAMKSYPFALPTAEADAFLDTITLAEARSMLMELLGRDEASWIQAMKRVQRQRAWYAEGQVSR